MKACPDGWYLPRDAEWIKLINYVGSPTGTKLKAESGWTGSDYIEGTNDHGFSALPGGSHSSYNGFLNLGSGGLWWSATELNDVNAYYLLMRHNNDSVHSDYTGKSYQLSVRCVKD